MLYTVLTIWTALVVAALIGVIVGAVLRSSSGQHRIRELQDRLEDALVDAEQNRAEAVRLSASQSLAQADASERQRLVADLRSARAQIEERDHHLGEAHQRIEAMQAHIQGFAGDESAAEAMAGLQSRAQHAEAELARLTEEYHQLSQTGNPSDADLLAALRAENEQLQDRVSELMHENPDLDGMRNRIIELETENRARADRDALLAERNALRSRVAAIDAAEREHFEAENDEQKIAWLDARNQWLQERLDEAKAGVPLAADVDVPGLRAEIDELKSKLSETQSALDEARLVGVSASNGEASDPAQANPAEVARLRWRNRYLASRVKYLEGKVDAGVEQLRAELIGDPEKAAQDAEVSRLRARISQLEREPRSGASGEDDREQYSMEWRNRYLSSRVRYLEQQLAERNADVAQTVAAHGGAMSEAAAQRLKELEARVAETDQLRERIAELEHAARKKPEAGIAEPSTDREADGQAGFALEWRNRYLTSRVRYLEERLAELRSDKDEAAVVS
jgi:uncharacterized membrane-anchored protein YhcB (DUF1043 family)